MPAPQMESSLIAPDTDKPNFARVKLSRLPCCLLSNAAFVFAGSFQYFAAMNGIKVDEDEVFHLSLAEFAL